MGELRPKLAEQRVLDKAWKTQPNRRASPRSCELLCRLTLLSGKLGGGQGKSSSTGLLARPLASPWRPRKPFRAGCADLILVPDTDCGPDASGWRCARPHRRFPRRKVPQPEVLPSPSTCGKRVQGPAPGSAENTPRLRCGHGERVSGPTRVHCVGGSGATSHRPTVRRAWPAGGGALEAGGAGRGARGPWLLGAPLVLPGRAEA